MTDAAPLTDAEFPDHEFLTVRELAALLRLKERKVYDLAASGAVPCSRATGKLLFPASEIRAWIARAQTGGAPGAAPQPGPAATRPADLPPILLGSHDPLLDWAIRQSRCGLATYHDGSHDGLARFARGEGVASGLHIHDAATGRWNSPAVAQAASGLNAVLLRFATRRRGIVHRPDAPAPAGLRDLAGPRFVPRQPGSGTDTLFRHLAARDGLDLSALVTAAVARTEDDAVEAVRRGDGDATFGLETVARMFGLGFVPVIDEEFALLVDRKAWFDPPLRRLMAFCAGAEFTDRAARSGGHDVTGLGSVVWNA